MQIRISQPDLARVGAKVPEAACIRADFAVSTFPIATSAKRTFASCYSPPASACFWCWINILTPTTIVNDDPSTAQGISKVEMSVTKY